MATSRMSYRALEQSTPIVIAQHPSKPAVYYS